MLIMLRMIPRLTILLVLADGAAPPTFGRSQQTVQPDQVKSGGATTQPDGQDWAQLRARFMDQRYQVILSGILWSVSHAAESRETLDQFFGLLKSAGPAIDGDDPNLLKDLGGVTGFKGRLVTLARSNDDAVAAGAAIMLGICGDQRYASELAQLLKKTDRPGTDDGEFHPVTVRGRAAMALGLLDAKQYAPDLVALLNSKNEYDQGGAAMGLGYLGDRRYSKAVAALLDTRDDMSGLIPGVAESAMISLVLMGAAADYSDKIARMLRSGRELPGETVETAAYALAVAGAKEHAPDIAVLLRHDHARGYAAKALGLMGATEYAKEIAALLAGQHSSDREAAALALGVMGARQYAGAVAKLLRDAEQPVRYRAAVAIVLMEAHDYDAAAIPVIEKTHQAGYRFNESDFNQIAHDQFVAIKARFEESLAKIKKQSQD
jgi:HEAT repeat protein